MANTIRWDTEVMEAIAQRLKTLSSELSSCRSTVRSIASRMDQASGGQLDYQRSVRLSMSGLRVGDASIKSCLSQYANALDRYQSLSSQLATNIKNASQNVESEERALCSLISRTGAESPFAEGSSGASVSGSTGSAGDSASDDSASTSGISWKSLALDILSKFGIVGKITSGILGQDGSIESALKGVAKIGDGIAKWMNLKDGEWQKLFGLEKFLTNPSTASNWFTAFGQNAWAGFKNGVANPLKWITSGITSFFDNLEEFGGKLTDRAIVEWATETVTSVATYAGTAALVGAGFILAGVSANAFAVGAVATLLYNGVDVLWKNTIGNGSSIVESVGHAVGEIYDDAKKWVGNTLNSIKNGLNIRALWA